MANKLMCLTALFIFAVWPVFHPDRLLAQDAATVLDIRSETTDMDPVTDSSGRRHPLRRMAARDTRPAVRCADNPH